METTSFSGLLDLHSETHRPDKLQNSYVQYVLLEVDAEVYLEHTRTSTMDLLCSNS